MAVSWPQAMNLFKTGLCLPLFAITLLVQGTGPPLAGIGSGSLWILLASGVIGMSLGDTAYFASLSRIGARRTMLVQCLAPIFTAALALASGERLPGAVQAFGVGCVLFGLVLVLRERPVGTVLPGHAKAGLLFAVAAALCQAIGIVMTKRGLREANVLQASTIRIFAGVVGILLLELTHGQMLTTIRHALRPPSLARILPAALMGSFLGFFLFQVAVQRSDSAVAAALTGMSPLFVAPLSVIFLGEKMKVLGWLGTIAAVAGVALVMLN
jgi:drug/metabolite transporter (DMT)-like permease